MWCSVLNFHFLYVWGKSNMASCHRRDLKGILQNLQKLWGIYLYLVDTIDTSGVVCRSIYHFGVIGTSANLWAFVGSDLGGPRRTLWTRMQIDIPCVMQTRLVRSRPIIGDSELCPLWTRYPGDLKTDSLDDPKIRTGLCSEDKMAIRFQNRVILCECLFLGHFLIYRCQ